MPFIKEIVIIGGSHAGLGIAKMILSTITKVKVTLISTSPDYYFNIAAPRLLARPDAVSIDQTLIPIEQLFSRHPNYQFEFVHATVTEFDPATQIIITDDGALRKYDYLVIASGSMFRHSAGPKISRW
jgi:NADH dehydrogenase FAD-containing subunit